jgi:hypothetical protein
MEYQDALARVIADVVAPSAVEVGGGGTGMDAADNLPLLGAVS